MIQAKNLDTPAGNPDPRQARLRPVLRGLNGASTDIEASAVVTGDGHTVASVLGDGVDPNRFGAMCASLLALADRAAQEVARGRLKQVLIEGDNGTMLLIYAGNDAVLALAAKPTANLGMVFIEARRAALKVLDVMLEA